MRSDTAMAKNLSESFVYEVCSASFLSPWSHLNPQGEGPGRELCDILVVFDPHIIVFSVKDVALGVDETKPNHARWLRKAVSGSLKQVHGAVRWLRGVDCVKASDGKLTIDLPPHERRIYHRISVACGGRREVAFGTEDGEGKALVHVFDEKSFSIVMRHLDTASDFVTYLFDKESFLSRTKVLMIDGEENLLAYYLCHGRKFPEGPDFAFLLEDLWPGISANPDFKQRVELDRVSYVWDDIIERFSKSDVVGGTRDGAGRQQFERALRIMAKEDRFSRRILGGSFLEFLEKSKAGDVRSRLIMAPSGVTYVFMVYDEDSSLVERRTELTARCFAAIHRTPAALAVVGIDLNVPGQKPLNGFTQDIVALIRDGAEWSRDVLAEAQKACEGLRHFSQPGIRYTHHDEFPPRP